MKNRTLNSDYATGYRDALTSITDELYQGHASFWTEEQFDTNKWLLERIRDRAAAVGQMLRDVERTESKRKRATR